MSTTTYLGTTGPDTFNVVPPGNYVITTGGGTDDIVVAAASGSLGTIVVTDFDTTSDIIDISAYFTNFASIQAAASQQHANTVIQLGSGGTLTLTLNNVLMGSLVASDFNFTSIAPPGGGAVTGTAAHHYTVSFEGVFQQYTVAGGGTTVSGGPEGGTDTLTNIQRIQFVDGYLAVSPTDTAAEVYRLYEAALGRAPDPIGLAGWTQYLNTGAMTLAQVVNGFVGSTEFQTTYGSLDNTAFVTLLYSNVLHRAPDPAGLNGWLDAMNSGETRAQVVLGFSESNENINNSAPTVEQGLWIGNQDAAEVARLYDTALGRLPDLPGLTGWTKYLENGTMTLLQEVNGFIGSAEFQADYGALDNTGFVTQLYYNTLHRAPDPTGLNAWVAGLNSGQYTRAQVVLGFSESNEHIADTAAHINNGIWLAS